MKQNDGYGNSESEITHDCMYGLWSNLACLVIEPEEQGCQAGDLFRAGCCAIKTWSLELGACLASFLLAH